MVRLRNKETGAPIAEITEAQLQFLIDHLVEESETDTDYYLNRDTLELLKEQGLDGGLAMALEEAFGAEEALEIVWTLE
jgi:hypothetical protein